MGTRWVVGVFFMQRCSHRLALPLIGVLLGCHNGPTADHVFQNGVLYTSIGQSTDALAVDQGLVVATGDDARDLIGAETTVTDLDGATGFPGFTDSHVHLLAGSFVMDKLLLLGASSMNSVLSSTGDYATE